MISSFYLFDEIKYEDQKNEFLKRQIFITESQAIIIPPHIVDRDEERITLTLSGILSNPIIIGVAVYGRDGKSLYRFGKFKSDHFEVFKVSHDIKYFDGNQIRTIGRLETIATDKQIVENFRQRREFYGLIFLILFFVIVIATYTLIHLVVAIPLNRLVAAINNSSDDKPLSVNWSSRDEIGMLINEFQNLQDRQFEAQSLLRAELQRSKEISADLRVMKEAAEQANRAKSEFLATMSHELRTPLNAIIGFSEVIKNEALGPVGVPQYQEYSQHINESGAHLLAIINDVLDMSKIEAGEMTPFEDAFDFAGAVESTVRVMSITAVRENVKLITEVSANLPQFVGDERMIKQILLNLLSNAVKFTPENGKVVLMATADENGFLVSVIDTGIGIPEDKMETVLQPFGQADSSLARKYEGTGLGLPLVKAMAELHGGVLSMESVVDEGTKIEIRFPASRIHRPATERIDASQYG